MSPRNNWFPAALVAGALLAGFAGAAWWRNSPAPVVLATGSLLSPPRALPDFSLIDHHGRRFASADLRGHWSLLFFGYTNCPEFCPATLVTLAALEQRLRAAGAPVRPQVLFMSVDAARDTPAQLANYVPHFDPDFIGLTAADQPAIERVAAKLGVAVVIMPKNADGSYGVDHSGAIYVVDPDGRLAAILTGPFTPAALASDFERIVAGRA